MRWLNPDGKSLDRSYFRIEVYRMASQPTRPQQTQTATDRLPPPANDSAMGRALFRQEVLRGRSNQWLGKSTLAVPVSFAVYSVSALGLIGLITAFLAFFSYSPTENVNAVIVPKSGISKVFGAQAGVVVTRYVREGQRISAGTPIVAVRAQGEQGLQGSTVSQRAPRRRPVDSTATPADASESPAEARNGIADLRPEPRRIAAPTVDIRAPVDGTVYQVNKSEGEIFYDFEPLASIATDGDLSVSALVSPATHARIEMGMPVRMELDAFKGRTTGMLSGRVIGIATGPTEGGDLPMRQQGPSYRIVVLVDQATSALPREKLLGKAVKIRFSLQKRKLYEWLLDPIQAVF